jgi:hypothetical protein
MHRMMPQHRKPHHDWLLSARSGSKKTRLVPVFQAKTPLGCQLHKFPDAPAEKLTVIALQHCNNWVL